MVATTYRASCAIRSPNNLIPASRIDPNALALMQLVSGSRTRRGLNNNYVVNRLNNDDTHAFDMRVDHNFSGNDRFFARYSYSNNHKIRPSPFDGDADGGGFSEGDEKVRVHGFAASHTHMFSSTLINEARFGVSREHTNRLQPNGDDTEQPARALRDHGRAAGGRQWRPPGHLYRRASSMLGHAGWVVSERFSNTTQFSDNLTKVYKSHTFKGGYIYQDIFFGSTQPPYARGEYNWDGRYTSVVNQTDGTTGRANMLLKQIPSPVPGGVDFAGGMNVLRVSPFGAVDAFKTYHGAYAQDSWRVSQRLTVNAGLRWDYFSREQERQGEQSNMVPGPPSRYLIPAEQRDIAALAKLRQQPREGWHRAGLHGSSMEAVSAKCRITNFAPRLDAAYQIGEKYVCARGMASTTVRSRTAAATRAWGTTIPSSSRFATSRPTPLYRTDWLTDRSQRSTRGTASFSTPRMSTRTGSTCEVSSSTTRRRDTTTTT